MFRCVLLLTLALSACTTQPVAPRHLRLIPGSSRPESVDGLVLAQRAASKGRTVLVYAGAGWCEPCRHFHEAAEKGELDREFGDVDLLTFDLDLDDERLAASNYETSLIPMIAVPGADGKGTGRQMNGSIKGDGAVAEMTPRLKALLAR